MSWQDLVISGGSFIITLSLIPTVLAKEKPAPATSLITAAILSIFVVTFASLSLWFTAIVNVFTATLWFTLFFQRLLRKRHPVVK